MFTYAYFNFSYLAYEEIGTGYENVDLQTEENDVRYTINTLKSIFRVITLMPYEKLL